jgi:DNA-binding transcriptional regulator GbsR (MarR family)
MTDSGWIKLHRKIMDNPIYKRSTLYHLFNHCLLSSNHKPQKLLYAGRVIQLDPGQFSTTTDEISKKTGIAKTTVYDGLKRLSNLNIISQKPERRKTIISVINWHSYQHKPNDSRMIPERYPNDARRKALSGKGLRTKQECKNERIYTLQAAEIYSAYPRKADENNSLKSIQKLLKSGMDKKTLLRAVDNYKASIQRKGTKEDYIIQSNNFFGRAERYKEYLDAVEENKVNPVELAIQRCKERGDI